MSTPRAALTALFLMAAAAAAADGPFAGYSLPPCRIFDTRDASGPTSGGPLNHASLYGFTIADKCGVPVGAKGAFFNVVATSASATGHLTLFPSVSPEPNTSTINFVQTTAIANGAFVALGDGGGPAGHHLWVRPSVQGGQVHMILDVNGYVARNAAAKALDFNGDGKSDLLCRVASPTTGTHSIATSTGTVAGGWSGGGVWSVPAQFACTSDKELLTGDFNGDGLTDLACHSLSGATVGDTRVALNAGNGTFSDGSIWLGGWCREDWGQKFGIGDFNGDGKSDFFCHEASGNNWIAISTGTSIATPSMWATWCAADWVVGDFNGDNRSDLWCHDPSTFANWTTFSNGNGFAGGALWGPWCAGQFGVGDFDGDGKSDFYCHAPAGTNWVGISNGVGGITGGGEWGLWCDTQLGTGDWDGDTKSDLLCHFSSGPNHVALSTGSSFNGIGQWGANFCAGGQLIPSR